MVILVLAVIGSCYQEKELTVAPDAVFDLLVTPELHEFINASRDTSYVIDEPGMQFLFEGEALNLNLIKTRGKSALNFHRKSFAVFLNEPMTISGRNGTGPVQLKRFKLISLAMDYTYIENRIAFGILEEQDIMPLFYRFVEMKINGSTQGVYLLVEDPEQYYIDRGSEFILRRGYYNSIEDAEYEPAGQNIPKESYETRFQEIYGLITELQGEELYNALSERLDLEQYFRKMGIDFLLKNGDYTDEIYLYALINQDKIRFNIIPWDYDDIFKSDPHEVGITWGTGRLFGERYYPTYQDVLDVLGDKLIFSIEDDLDYAIAMDPYCYARYENTIKAMIGEITGDDIDVIFDQVRTELRPYYYWEEIIAQSRYDQKESTRDIWEVNMQEKKDLLKERLNLMKQQLKEVQP
jgi:spore coat protein H